jgi:hypothetical protein
MTAAVAPGIKAEIARGDRARTDGEAECELGAGSGERRGRADAEPSV